ncbi:MAG: zf-TFIIB domain-containing protein [Thermodesulfobacteriota bacterium]
MICPRCQNELLETSKQGVVLDHCPDCGGIWLDRGELGKIIAHMKQVESSLEAEFRPSYEPRESYERRESYGRHPDERRPEDRHYDRRYDKNYDKAHYHKKKSPFEKLFDIFD